jgi:hypothetical protein
VVMWLSLWYVCHMVTICCVDLANDCRLSHLVHIPMTFLAPLGLASIKSPYRPPCGCGRPTGSFSWRGSRCAPSAAEAALSSRPAGRVTRQSAVVPRCASPWRDRAARGQASKVLRRCRQMDAEHADGPEAGMRLHGKNHPADPGERCQCGCPPVPSACSASICCPATITLSDRSP